ncbi:MAG: DUF4474 domain-containing protein [Desulfitobacteriia bacterium]|jgi:hypothetical protein
MIFQKFKINKENRLSIYQEIPLYNDYKPKFFLRRFRPEESFAESGVDKTDFKELLPEETKPEEVKPEESRIEKIRPAEPSQENKSLKKNKKLPKGTGDEELDKIIALAGYAYDPTQDIFYSTMNPWQRNVGYCRLYDEAAAPLGMIMDCEPVYFEYDNREWMISFWKGQYDMVTGGEIGIYTNGKCLNIPGFFRGNFYQAVSDNELLQMSYTLKKNGQVLFNREDKHWWLTGFKLGEFSEPSELTMDIRLTFDNLAMRDAFLKGLRKAGYKDKKFTVDGKTVSFTFAKPHTRQPFTRTKETDKIIQKKNKLLCELYQEITAARTTAPEKIKILKKQAPDLYEKVLKIGKDKKTYEVFYVIIMIFKFALTFFITNKESCQALPFKIN